MIAYQNTNIQGKPRGSTPYDPLTTALYVPGMWTSGFAAGLALSVDHRNAPGVNVQLPGNPPKDASRRCGAKRLARLGPAKPGRSSQVCGSLVWVGSGSQPGLG